MQPPELHSARLPQDFWKSRARRSISLETTYASRYLTNRSAIGIRSLILGSQSVYFNYVAPGRHVSSDRQVTQITSIPYGSCVEIQEDHGTEDVSAFDLFWIEQVHWVDGVVERFNPVRLNVGRGSRRSLLLHAWDTTAQQLRAAGQSALLARFERDHVSLRGIVARQQELVSITRGGEINIPSSTHLRWPV
ncbi:hypothetical protein BH23BAC4_BH23BAC4_03520 [soil metagenome]